MACHLFGVDLGITWSNGGVLLIGLLGINFNEVMINQNNFFKKMNLKMSPKGGHIVPPWSFC